MIRHAKVLAGALFACAILTACAGSSDPSASESVEGSGTVPLPPAENLVEDDEPAAESLQLDVGPGLADLYDLGDVDDFVVFDDNDRQVAMTEAFTKQGRTYGSVTWTIDGQTQSTTSRASQELAECAADRLAGDLNRFEAELMARGVFLSDATDEQNTQLFDTYIECGGFDELLTSYTDDIYLQRAPFDRACIEAAITTPDQLQIAAFTATFETEGLTDLVGPCFRVTDILSNQGVLLTQEADVCLTDRSVAFFRAFGSEDENTFIELLSECLSADELATLGLG